MTPVLNEHASSAPNLANQRVGLRSLLWYLLRRSVLGAYSAFSPRTVCQPTWVMKLGFADLWVDTCRYLVENEGCIGVGVVSLG